jgi:hypothetical protein
MAGVNNMKDMWQPISAISAGLSAVSIAILLFMKSGLFKFSMILEMDGTSFCVTDIYVVYITAFCAILFLSSVYLCIDSHLDEMKITAFERLKHFYLPSFLFGWFLLYVIVGFLLGGAWIFITSLLGTILLHFYFYIIHA